MRTTPPHALLPSTPLPSGWAIEPVSGRCVRLSDGAQFGRTTSWALAWSMQDILETWPEAGERVLDLARLRNAVGCAVTGATFSGDATRNRRAASAVRSVGEQMQGDGHGPWHWQPAAPVSAHFNDRLGSLLDTIGLDRGERPAAHPPEGKLGLLMGCIGRIAVRSTLHLAGDAPKTAQLTLQAEDGEDASGALQRVRAWALAAARECLASTPAAALALVYRMPGHEDDRACTQIVSEARRRLDRRVA